MKNYTKYQPDNQEINAAELPTPDELADAIIDDLLATVKTSGRIINRRILAKSIMNGFAKFELVSVDDDGDTHNDEQGDSLEKDFNQVAQIARMDFPDDLDTRYSVHVGDPDQKETFLDCGKFISEDFTTYRDAKNACELVRRILAVVDEANAQGLKIADVRDEVLAAVGKKFDVDGNPEDPDLINLRPAVEYAIKAIFDYYLTR